jgi:hypothetical protein
MRGAIANQVPRGVVLEAGVRRAVAAAALVKHDDAVHSGIKKAAQAGGSAAPRTTVNDNNWLAHRIAALLVVNCVNIGNLEHAGAVRVDVRVEL